MLDVFTCLIAGEKNRRGEKKQVHLKNRGLRIRKLSQQKINIVYTRSGSSQILMNTTANMCTSNEGLHQWRRVENHGTL